MKVSEQPEEERPSHRVKDVPEQLRPRELFDRLGAEHVPEDALLAILLRSGTQGKNVIELSRELLHRYRSLRELVRAPAGELATKIGKTKGT